MKIDLDAEIQNIDRLLTEATTKAAYWKDEAKKLEGAKAFAEHLIAISAKVDPSDPGSFRDMEDEDAPVPVGAGANGSHP